MLKGDVDIGLIPTTISPITKVKVVYCWLFQDILLLLMQELYIDPRPATIPPKEETVGVVLQDMELCPKRLTTFFVQCWRKC